MANIISHQQIAEDLSELLESTKQPADSLPDVPKQTDSIEFIDYWLFLQKNRLKFTENQSSLQKRIDDLKEESQSVKELLGST